jgi:heterodisulfide reductase subunit B
MRYALFLGCTIPARLSQYEASARAVLETLGVELTDIREFNCCGYPLRNTDHRAALLAAARNLALAEKSQLPLLVLCQCGYGMLSYAAHILREDRSLKKHITTILKKEGLKYKGDGEIKHLLSVLFHDIGVDTIKKTITRSYHELKIATHYGCHALRPSEVVHFDDPVNPTLFDTLVEITGAESISWQARLECCGAPLFGSNDALSVELTQKKLTSAKQSGAQFICDSCPYCHLQLDTVQKMMMAKNPKGNHSIAPILYTQLLGLSLGIDTKTLGLEMNQIDITGVEEFLSG